MSSIAILLTSKIAQIGQRFAEQLKPQEWAEIFICSNVFELPRQFVSDDEVPGINITATRTTNHKCGRCWRHLPEVTEDGALCSRCDQVVSGMDAHA